MHNYFEGWYFKCQEEDKTLALIPARHRWLYGGAGGDSLPGNGIPPCHLSGGKAVKIQDGALVIRQGDWPGKPQPGTFSGHRRLVPCTVSSGKAPAAMPSIPSG